MEHLPQPRLRPTSAFPSIPYLCRTEYDKKSFVEYPQRMGLPNLEDVGEYRFASTLSEANKHLLVGMPPSELEPFLQNWLFFGLLSEILGDLYRHEDFITSISEREAEKVVITTAKLVPQLERWATTIAMQDKGSSMVKYKHIAECLKLSYACLDIDYSGFDKYLKFHLVSVAKLLGFAANKACDVAWTDDPIRSLVPINWSKTIDMQFRKSLLLVHSDCCPSQLQMLIHKFPSTQALGFIANCFSKDRVQSQHTNCKENKFEAGNSQSFDHVPRHVSASCRCEFIDVQEQELAECLEQGVLPLLRIQGTTSTDDVSLQVIASTGSVPYVALSHVWADGLGNPDANALPRCQIFRLKMLIDRLVEAIKLDSPEDTHPDLLLWCDTLCCPAAPGEAKNMALRQMYSTYDKASVVLVLDNGLMADSTDPKEACLRVALSRWMTRLWTLQEGALPGRKDKLWFQFRNTAARAWALYKNLNNTAGKDIQWRGVTDNLTGRFHNILALLDFEPAEHSHASLQHTMSSLMYRSVTVLSDEPLLIAALLALTLDELIMTDPSKRMALLWRMIASSPSGVPTHLIFIVGPRIHEPGLRWAPQSLLTVDHHYLQPGLNKRDQRGFLVTKESTKGLAVELAGMRISIARPAKGLPPQAAGFESLPQQDRLKRHMLLMGDCRGCWYVLRHRLADTPSDFASLEEMWATISRVSNPWVLYRGFASLIPEVKKRHHGLLVEENQQEDQLDVHGIASVETRSQVAFGNCTREMSQVCQVAYELSEELARSPAACRLAEFEGADIDLENPLYLEAFQAVAAELIRLSTSDTAINALAASGNEVDERGMTRIREHIDQFFVGTYIRIEKYLPGDTTWYVD